MKNSRLPLLALGALALAGSLFSGCLNEASQGPKLPKDQAQLNFTAKLPDVNNSNALHKGSVIKLKKLVITLTSSFAGDSVIRDTIIASDTANSKFTSTTTENQSFEKRYAIKPLRHWTVVVKTLDTRDSIIHRDSVVALNMLAGETRSVSMDLEARYVMYQVKFSVPDSLRSVATQQAQKVIITRFVMKIDSVVAIDSSSLAGFSSFPTVHTADFDYIPAKTRPDVIIRFYGHSAGTNDTLLFQAIIPDVDPEVTQLPVNAIYVGPGSGPSGGGAINRLIINIGKINTIVFNTNVDGTVPFKRTAQ